MNGWLTAAVCVGAWAVGAALSLFVILPILRGVKFGPWGDG